MPDEIKPAKSPSQSEIDAKVNAEASLTYKEAVGKTFTDGEKKATVKEYVGARLTNKGPRQCFLVNYGHPNASFFVTCFEFMAENKPFVEGENEIVPDSTNLPK